MVYPAEIQGGRSIQGDAEISLNHQNSSTQCGKIAAGGSSAFNGGNVGVNTISSSENFHLSTSSPAHQWKGDVYYDSSAQEVRVYTNPGWQYLKFE